MHTTLHGSIKDSRQWNFYQPPNIKHLISVWQFHFLTMSTCAQNRTGPWTRECASEIESECWRSNTRANPTFTFIYVYYIYVPTIPCKYVIIVRIRSFICGCRRCLIFLLKYRRKCISDSRQRKANKTNLRKRPKYMLTKFYCIIFPRFLFFTSFFFQ